MWIQLESAGYSFRADLNSFYDLSLPVAKTINVNCYHLQGPSFSYYESPEFSGNLSAGGSVNCERVGLYAHASGTHTECALHVADAGFDMRHVHLPPLLPAMLLTASPSRIGDDEVIDAASLPDLGNAQACTALIVRSLPNSEEKRHRNYSGSNPVYFAPELLLRIKALGFKHLLCDLPSIDRESDGGRLQAHKNWFLEDGLPSPERTVTELIYVPDAAADGLYLLNMQAPLIETDAVPSRIVIYPCV